MEEPEENLSTRARSLAAALDVVREVGLTELSTRAISRKSGLTQPAIYRHFTGVEELIRETLAGIRDLFVERLSTGGGHGDTRRDLIETLNAFRDFAIDEPRLYDALFLRTDGVQPTPPSADGARNQNIFTYVAERVSACSREGVIRESGPVASALSLVAHAQGLILLYRQGRFASKERFSEFYVKSMEDLLRGLA